MTGTIVNAIAVVVAGLIGLFLKKGVNDKLQETMMQVLGLCTFLIGLNGVLGIMLSSDVSTGKISSQGEMLLLVSLAIGAFIGTKLDLEHKIEVFGKSVEDRFGADGFAKGFVTASLLFCIGAMAVIGPINDALNGDPSVLFVKASLDFISGILLASTLGFGVIFAAVPVFVVQGSVALLASFLSNYLVGDLLSNICMVGYAIVMMIGINFFGVVKIKTANLIPALLIPVLYDWILPILSKLLNLLKIN